LFTFINAFVDVSVFVPNNIYSPEVIAVSAEERRTVIPLGTAVGVDINMRGVKVVDVGDSSPARDAGVRAGDNIVRVNGLEVQSVEDVSEIINEQTVGDESATVKLEIERQDKSLNISVEPKRLQDGGDLKIGAWVKDSTSGIGTLTFYDPENSTFGALGHGITDGNGEPLNIEGGTILNSTVVSVRRSERGQIGELRGIFLEGGRELGEIKINNNQGLYGILDKERLDLHGATEMPVAQKREIRTGNAQILSNIESVRVEAFDIEIQRIARNSNDNTKEMIIRITDDEL